MQFFRHDRNYWIFSLTGNPYMFLYFSHTRKDLRSLFYGTGFLDKIPRLKEKPDLCIECGLGTRIRGGVSLDNGEVVTFHCNRDSANRLIGKLRKSSGSPELWILDI
jgi:hypothetical protein